MNKHRVRNSVLALVGLASLSIYILACASFSPDDKKVLYPAFDGESRSLGVALYDRETARTRIVFVPLSYSGTNVAGTALMRHQWLGDGRRILVSWSCGENSDGLNLAVIPVAGDSAVKLFKFPQLKEVAKNLVMPLPVVGQRAFLLESSVALLRLDLATGRIVRHELPRGASEFAVYPGAGDESVFYFEEQSDKSRVFGRIDPRTFALAPLITFTNEVADGSFFAYDEQGKRIAFVEQDDSEQRLVVLEVGKPKFTQPITGKGEERWYGNAVFLPRQDSLLASYRRDTTNAASFGLLEIPLKSGPIRDTVLLSTTKSTDESAVLYFQVGVSHDGKTAALSSTYLACESKEFKADDCALFLVDLSDPRRKVVKVPIPMPSKRSARPSL